MQPRSEREGRDLLSRNRRYYDRLWADASLIEPQRFNTWPLVHSLVSTAARRLEVAPGLRPRLPLIGTQFVDISAPAAAKLHAQGAHSMVAQATALPFAQGTFDLVCALDIIEHVDDDNCVMSELSRVTRAGGSLLLSAPLHPSLWTPFDEIVGHKRRYEPQRLLEMLSSHQLVVERTAIFGMQPNSFLVGLGMWWLVHDRERAMWWYNRVFMRLGLRFQKKLRFCPGMVAPEGVDEVLFVCRRA